MLRERLRWCYETLLAAYGPQGWWPGDGPFEVMVGAILTQNTAWRNVERALENLKAAGVLSPAGLRDLPRADLEPLLRPAGYYRLKAGRLQALVAYLWREHAGDPAALAHGDLAALRPALLAVPGVGPETADSILLYAANRPTFVVDAYTRRLLARLGWVAADALGAPPPRAGTPSRCFWETVPYEQVQAFFLAHLPLDAELFSEYHALIVRHARERCRKRDPRCAGCALGRRCGRQISSSNDSGC